MAAQLIQETEAIDVSCLSVLIYGPPGAWKTSLAQTADKPITLDFDMGAHRAFNRKTVMRFGNWSDVAEAAEGSPALNGHKTIVIDTIGRLLDLLSTDIIQANAKHGSKTGGLTLQGFGALKARFAFWIKQASQGKRDCILIAHEKEEREGDNRYMRPDVQGGSYNELMKMCELVGYLDVDGQGRRFLDFNPSDRHLGKNAAGWPRFQIPDLKEKASFLSDLLTDAKSRIGKTAEASAAIAKAVDEWQAKLATDPNLDDLNAMLPELSALTNGAKKQAWHLVTQFAEKAELVFDKTAKKFGRKEGNRADY